MASNNHRKRRSHLAAPAEPSNQSSASVSSPTKKARQSLSTPNQMQHQQNQQPSIAGNSNPNNSLHICGLGLCRIYDNENKTETETETNSSTKAATSLSKQQQQQQQQPSPNPPPGPLIFLSPNMYLGRTPPSMATVSKKNRHGWTRQEVVRWFLKHKSAQKYAVLGIDKDPSFSKQEKELVSSVSRTLLRVVKERNGGLLLQRSSEARKSDGRLAKQILVKVHRKRKRKGIENETNSSNESISEAIHVHPNTRVVLRKGDVLTILNDKYRYKVVDTNPNTTKNEHKIPATTGIIKSTRSEATGTQGDAIELLLETSSSSDGSSNPSRSRRSSSSVNDRTIALGNDDNDSFDNQTRDAIRISLQESWKQHTATTPTTSYHNPEEIIHIQSSTSSSDDDQKPAAKPSSNNEYKFETPDCKVTSKSNQTAKIANVKPNTRRSIIHRQTIGAKSIKATTKKSNEMPIIADDKPITRRSIRNAKPIETSAKAGRKSDQEFIDARKAIKRTSTRLCQPATKSSSSSSNTHESNQGKSNVDSIGKRLRQKNLRIKTVQIHYESEQATIGNKVPTESEQANIENKAPTNGPIFSLESPTKRFWDPLWSGDLERAAVVTPAKNLIGTAHGIETVDSQSTTDNSPLSKTVSPLPCPTDISASNATYYWNALNSARPREGYWYLNACVVAANTVPGLSLCQKWMTLLTWGPKLITTVKKSPKNKPEKRNYSWDGPRIEYSMSLWKKALGLHPQILLPRMIASAPGGPSEWWKTCLEYDEMTEREEHDEDENAFVGQIGKNATEVAQTAIKCLRMRSARLEAFLHLLEANLAFEEEHLEKLRIEKEENGNKDGCSSDEDEREETNEAKDREKAFVLLREIRSFGEKPALRLVAQSMSKFWVSQRNYLGYDSSSIEAPSETEQDWALEQERSDIVQEVASHLANGLCLLRRALKSSPQETVSRRSSRRLGNPEIKLSDRDIGEILWNSMDLEVRERVPKLNSQKRKRKTKHNIETIYEEPEPKDAFLVEWVFSLQETMGNEFAEKLAERVGVVDHYKLLWEL